MTFFVQVEVLSGESSATGKLNTVVINADRIIFAQSCKYESAIAGLQKDGTQIVVEGVGTLLIPHPYDAISGQLLAGEIIIGAGSN